MDKKTIYANGFALATNGAYEEVVILFNLATPHFSEDGAVSGVSFEEVADLRITRSVAQDLCRVLTRELNKPQN